MKRPFWFAALAVLAVVPTVNAGYLMVPNFSSSTGRSIMLFNKDYGWLVNQNWILGDSNNVLISPTEALAIGSDVWITNADPSSTPIGGLGRVFRYSLILERYKPAITGSATLELNNVFGLERVGNTVYVVNAGLGLDENEIPTSFGNAIVMFDVSTGAYLGHFPILSDLHPYDVKYYDGYLLVSNYSGSQSSDSRIDKYDLTGNYLGNFYFKVNNDPAHLNELTGPQQISIQPNGNLLVGGFMSMPPAFTSGGVWEMNGTGQLLAKYASGGPRAGFRMGNGKIMYTDGAGVWSWDPILGEASVLIPNVNAKYINELAFIPPRRGDLNCDDWVDDRDINPFVLALVSPEQYALSHPNCFADAADLNCDEVVNGLDIAPFIEAVLYGLPPCP